MIFEGYRKYYINREDISHADRLPIPLSYFHWDEEEIMDSIRQMKISFDDAMNGVYMLAFNNTTNLIFPIHAHHNAIALNVITNEWVFMWDLNRARQIWKRNKSHYPNYTIIHDQNEYQASGYIIHKSDFIFMHKSDP